MEKEMYSLFYQIQKKHWWFVSKKNIVLDLISAYAKKSKFSKILDMGCGSGLMLSSFQTMGDTYGMDTSDDAVEFSKKISPTCQIKKGFLPNEIPFERNYFELITALDVIEHVDDDQTSLIRIYESLAANGRAVITVPAFMFLWSDFDTVNEHKRRYTIDELQQKLIKAGFKIEKISYYNFILFPIVYIVRMINKLLGRPGSSDLDMPSNLVNYMLKQIFGFEKYLLRFMNLPFGVSLIAVVKK